MKNLISFFFICSLWIVLAAQSAFAQEENGNLIERVDLYFSVTSEHTPAEVGFDNPKSYWSLEYELRLTDSATLEKIGRCHRNEEYKFVCPLDTGKKLDKKIRRVSSTITKGKFKKTGLLTDASRDIVIPLKLSPEVIDIFNKAVTSENNPTFVLFVKSKIYTKTADKIKLKKKLVTSSNIRPLKFYRRDKTVEGYWNVKKIDLAFNVYRQGNVIRVSRFSM
jgi:hypothetical protein